MKSIIDSPGKFAQRGTKAPAADRDQRLSPRQAQRSGKPPRILKHFPASIGRFADRASREIIDELAQWVEDYFHADLLRRPSKHVYVRELPTMVRNKIDRLRDGPTIRAEILAHFDSDHVIWPMKHTDELYISHYNKDRGGDEGLYGKHYDGNLRFLRFGTVVRSLIYLQSDGTYTVVFASSDVKKAFTTYDFGILDFHRELHWVEGEFNPDDDQRILLKCNYFVAQRANDVAATLAAHAVMAVNTAVFYVVKAAMEYSKSPRTPPQRAVGIMCNLFRVLNNIHPFVPLALLLSVLTAAGWGFYYLVTPA